VFSLGMAKFRIFMNIIYFLQLTCTSLAVVLQLNNINVVIIKNRSSTASGNVC